jgi:nitroreductase
VVCILFSTLVTELGCKEAKVDFNKNQKYLFEIFTSRRSVRNFMPDPIPEDHIMRILDIARTAPTAGNQQPWKFMVIQDRKKIDRLKAESVDLSVARARRRGESDEEKLKLLRQRMEKSYNGYCSASVIIIVLTDSKSKYPGYNEKDGVLAAGYLLIAARSLGYGSVFTTDSFSEEVVKKVFDIPEQYHQICVIPIGVPENWPDPPDKKSLDEFIVFENFPEISVEAVSVEKKVIKLDENVLEQYVGDYDFKGELTITISQEIGQLFMESAGQQRVRIFPESETKFFLKVVDASITFIKNNENQVVELIAHQQGQDFRAIKIK